MPSNLTTTQSSSDENAAALVPGDEWIQEFGTNGYDSSSAVAVDGEGNVYVTGITEGDFGGINNGKEDIWLSKYDSNGDRLWIEQWGTAFGDSPGDLSVDRNGNIYIAARTFALQENSVYANEYALIKYDTTGNLLSVDPQPKTNAIKEIEVDGAGNLYILGLMEDKWFVAKNEINGDRQWLKEFNSSFGGIFARFSNLTVNNGGDVYWGIETNITGRIPYETLNSIVKYSSEGNEQWSKDFSGTSLPSINSDSQGNAYIFDNGELSKYNNNGNLQWQYQWEDKDGSQSSQRVGVDRDGNSYLLVNIGGPEAELIKLDTTGSELSKLPLNLNASIFDLEVDGDGKVYLTGRKKGDFSGRDFDAWVGKSAANEFLAIANNGLNLDEGATATITSEDLQVADADRQEIPYTITALPTNGSLKFNNIEVAKDDTFSQADIDGGNLSYTHDGSETKDDSFSFVPPESSFWQINNRDFKIAVNPVNHTPTDITLSQNSIAENSEAGTIVGEFTTTDSDSDTHTYTLVDDAGGRFVIEGNQLKVADGSKLDFEKNSSHGIKVRTTDNGEPDQSLDKQLTVAVADINDSTVKSSKNYTLGETEENLTLTGKDAINGRGNKLDNRISGNNAKNRIDGKAGKDTLKGRGGNDILKGGEGNDNLDGGKGKDNLNGGKGRDRMTGGAGNDTFVVDNVKDVVRENGKGGKDIVKSSVSYSLPENVENLTLTGKGAINGRGNNAKNRIVGNNAKNRLNGKEGKDTLIGAGGNDILNGGKDKDTLDGGKGNDTLTGGGGSDRFVFNTGKNFRQASPGKDVIRDFKNGDNDKILLDRTTFGALDSKAGNGFSVIAEFDVVKSDRAVASQDAAIVYNENNGKLFYNANGSNDGLGGGGVFAVLDNSPQLQGNDFIIRA